MAGVRKVGQVLGILVVLAIAGILASTGANAREKELFVAAKNGDLQRVKSLLDEKADVNAKEVDGATALNIASENGHSEVVRMLLDAKADVNVQRVDGVTALIIASENGHLGVVRALLDAKAEAM